MRDSRNANFDRERVEALPDVSDQLDRIEGIMSAVESGIEKWSPLVLGCVVLVALSSLASSVALITVAVLAYGG